MPFLIVDNPFVVELRCPEAGFTAVLSKIAEVAPKHPNFKRDLGKSGESTFRYVFAQPNDANREITLTVLAFDVPTEPAGSATVTTGIQ